MPVCPPFPSVMIACRIDFQNLSRVDFEVMKEKQLFDIPRDLFYWERWCEQNGFRIVCGVDEAGRGPLAGPVVAAAVILLEPVCGLDDSKALNPRKRSELFERIMECGVVAWSEIDARQIDELNIFKATYLAMKRAVESLQKKPEFVLVDGPHTIPDLGIPQKALVRGDKASASVAAASIVAKVVRDRIMEEYHRRFPEYGFIRHKGYATKEHLEALKMFGPSPVHRLTFKGVVADD